MTIYSRAVAAFLCLTGTGFLFANPPARTRTILVPVKQFFATEYGGSYSGQPNGYGAGYTGAISEETIRALIAAINELNATLRDMRGGDPKSPSPKASAMERPKQVMLTKCASCHDKSKAAEHGKGFVLMEGRTFMPLSVEQQNKLMRLCFKNAMPKEGPKLTDEELGQIMFYIDNTPAIGEKKPIQAP
jgi:mono/diheme cytochrome c family protein